MESKTSNNFSLNVLKNLRTDLTKLQVFLLAFLFLIAVFFRFWQIRDYVVFLGDEGRDMLIMRNMILDIRPVFLGPTASVGGFYLGPIYYWMSAPFLALTLFDPVGPAIMVAIFGVATVLLLYKFLKETTSFYPAFFASLLYATAPLIVRYSRSSWNPNPLPFFSLLLIYFVYLGVKNHKLKYYFFAGLCFGIAFQLHYLSVMLIPVAGLIVLINTPVRKWLQIISFGIAGFLVTFSPFLLFEIKHNFPNFRTIFEFVTRDSTHGLRNPNIFYVISNTGNIFFENISSFKSTIFTRIFLNFLFLGGIYGLITNWENRQIRLIILISITWFIGGLFFLRYYSGQIFDYYYGFMFPSPFLLFGVILYLFWNGLIKNWKNKIIISIYWLYILLHVFIYSNNPYSYIPVFLITFLSTYIGDYAWVLITPFAFFPALFIAYGIVIHLLINKRVTRLLIFIIPVLITTWFVKNGFYTFPPNRLINQTASVADYVIEKSEEKPFNFALITDRNSDHAYRYFLEIKNHKPVELETMITEQLLIVCESKNCKPLGYPSWEIAGFGRGEIAGEWEIPDIGIKVLRLTHWSGEPSPAGKPAIKGN